jgi:SAM-dependent methyltransferase
VLCLGEGEGRNAVFLAARGLDVTALDLSAVGLEKAQRLAKERGVTITTQVADLADFDLGAARWGAVVASWCHLPPWVRTRVHGALATALKPGGRFVQEVYTPRQLAFDTGGPKNAELLYEPEVVRAELAGLRVDRCVELEREVHESEWHRGKSAVLQVLATKA